MAPVHFGGEYVRRALFRWIAALLLWGIIVACLIFSIRGANLSFQAVSYLRGRVMTPLQVEEREVIAEVARAFAAEWASFNAEDAEGYATRLAAFGLRGTRPPAKGAQRCLGASVFKVVTPAKKEDPYRVLVYLRVSRLVEAPEVFRIPDAERHLTLQEIEQIVRPQQGASPPPLRWEETAQWVEVAVRLKHGIPEVVGLPVVVPPPHVTAADPTQKISSERAPEDFVVFAKQALEFYYAGRDMSNFTVVDAKVHPVGGYRLDNAEVVSFSPSEKNAVAVVRAEISGRGIEKLPQIVILEVVKKDRWLLKRLGAM